MYFFIVFGIYDEKRLPVHKIWTSPLSLSVYFDFHRFEYEFIIFAKGAIALSVMDIKLKHVPFAS